MFCLEWKPLSVTYVNGQRYANDVTLAGIDKAEQVTQNVSKYFRHALA